METILNSKLKELAYENINTYTNEKWYMFKVKNKNMTLQELQNPLMLSNVLYRIAELEAVHNDFFKNKLAFWFCSTHRVCFKDNRFCIIRNTNEEPFKKIREELSGNEEYVKTVNAVMKSMSYIVLHFYINLNNMLNKRDVVTDHEIRKLLEFLCVKHYFGKFDNSHIVQQPEYCLNVIKNKLVSSDCCVIKANSELLKHNIDMPKEQMPLFNCWSEKKRSNLTDNAVLNMLVLDFDSGITREEAEQKYKDLEYTIYNSSSNTSKDNRFRIVMKLKNPIYAADLRKWHNILHKWFFKDADPSTFAVGRFFYLPTKYDKEHNLVEVTEHNGKLFDFYKYFPNANKRDGWSEINSVLADALNAKRLEHEAIDSQENIRKYISLIDLYGLTHYPQLAKACGCAKSRFRLSLNTALSIFLEKYEGQQKRNTIIRAFQQLWFKR